jgi:hypothetical protein
MQLKLVGTAEEDIHVYVRISTPIKSYNCARAVEDLTVFHVIKCMMKKNIS